MELGQSVSPSNVSTFQSNTTVFGSLEPTMIGVGFSLALFAKTAGPESYPEWQVASIRGMWGEIEAYRDGIGSGPKL